MITDSYDIETEPMINLFDFYGRRGDFADICLIIFSKEIHRHLLDSYESEIIATMPACNGDTHIYKTTYKGVTITFYLSGIGSAVASSQCHLASWLTGHQSSLCSVPVAVLTVQPHKVDLSYRHKVTEGTGVHIILQHQPTILI